MAELTIDNNTVELGDRILVFSKAGYSFDDWLTKDIPYSERVTLPETSLLNSIFFRPFQPEITGQKFSKFHQYKYKDNGKIVSSGVAKLLVFNENREYEIQLLDASFDLFENLKDKLNQVDFESSDFIFNTTAYNTLKILNSSAWIWSASSMHENKILSKNILSGNLAFSRPFFSVKRLIESIFAANGWIYDIGANASFFDSQIASANNEFVFTSYEKIFNETVVVSGSQALDLTSPDFIKTDSVTGTDTLQLNFDSKIRFRGNVSADSDLKLVITGSTLSGDNLVQEFFINKGSAPVDFTSELYKTANPTYNLTFTFTGNGSIDLEDLLLYTIIDENDFGAMSTAGFTDFKVKTYDNLPDIVQKELFKHCLVPIGGFFNTDNFIKKITINSVLSLSKLSAIDWTDKFIEGSEGSEGLTNYGKTNYYIYDNSDLKPINLGRGSFNISNETLPSVINVYESIFAASPEVLITDTMMDNTVYDDTERINEINNLIGYYEVIGGYTVARFENLNGNSVLSTYYANFIAAIQRGELIEARFNLNKSDYFLFDFTKLVYLQQKKSVFYVLNISDYSENEETTVRLLKT